MDLNLCLILNLGELINLEASNKKKVALNPIIAGGGVFWTPSNFAAFGDPLKVKYIKMFHADFSYLSIY